MEIDDSRLKRFVYDDDSDHHLWCECCVHSHLFLMDGIGICRLRNALVYHCDTCENFCNLYLKPRKKGGRK